MQERKLVTLVDLVAQIVVYTTWSNCFLCDGVIVPESDWLTKSDTDVSGTDVKLVWRFDRSRLTSRSAHNTRPRGCNDNA